MKAIDYLQQKEVQYIPHKTPNGGRMLPLRSEKHHFKHFTTSNKAFFRSLYESRSFIQIFILIHQM